MTSTDWAWTAAWILLGAVVGQTAGTFAVLLFNGLWVLIVIALPLLLLQLAFESLFWSIVRLFRRRRGVPPAAEPPPRREPGNSPLPRRYGFHAGFVLGMINALFTALRSLPVA